MLRITALSDFVGAIDQKHLIALAAISIVFAATVEIAGRGQARPLWVILNSGAAAVLFLTFAFFMFASRNSVVVARYGSSDLFLSVLLVVFGCMLLALAMRSLTEPGFFHPIFLILGGVTALVFSGLLAVLLPLAHKVYVRLF